MKKHHFIGEWRLKYTYRVQSISKKKEKNFVEEVSGMGAEAGAIN